MLTTIDFFRMHGGAIGPPSVLSEFEPRISLARPAPKIEYPSSSSTDSDINLANSDEYEVVGPALILCAENAAIEVENCGNAWRAWVVMEPGRIPAW